jgi:uncharacterized lipoprotein YddW (UPF0748 family)
MARRAIALLVLLTVACSIPVGQAPAASSSSPSSDPSPEPVAVTGEPQYRALWVDGFHDGIKTKPQVDRLLADARRANLNALFVQVRKRGDAYFNRSLEPRSNDILGPLGFDPLDYLVQRAHAAQPRLEVHAWVNVYYVSTTSRVYNEHGQEWGNRTKEGRTGGYLDPGHSDAARYTQNVLLEMVRSYAVDGLHLDFVRYPEGGDWGYSAAAVARFNSENGRSGVPEPNDPVWSQWRRDQVTGLVRGLARDLPAARKGVKLSAALICFGRGPSNDAEWQASSAYSNVFQDWRGWLAEGLIDLGVPMNYDSAWSPRQAGWFDLWTTWEKENQGSRGILIGIGAFLNYPEDTLAQIAKAMQPSAGGKRPLGVVLYSYASTSPYATDDYYTDPELAATLPRQPYADSPDPAQLAARARSYNDWFWALLSHPDYYRDPSRGWIQTQPVFPSAAPVPALPWR